MAIETAHKKALLMVNKVISRRLAGKMRGKGIELLMVNKVISSPRLGCKARDFARKIADTSHVPAAFQFAR